jgi:phosphohistidine phosphatase
MFELMLMRHAKSDWRSHTADIDRPLNKRGTEDAVRMGAYLMRESLVPDKMIVSAARRTQETASLLLENLPVPEEQVIVDQDLYLADLEMLCETIELFAADNSRLLILAHNPGMDNLASYLASVPPPLSASGKLMTTCSVVCFELDSVEALKSPGLGQLQRLIRPKEIAGMA